jgi:regulator of replication initiation timing
LDVQSKDLIVDSSRAFKEQKDKPDPYGGNLDFQLEIQELKSELQSQIKDKESGDMIINQLKSQLDKLASEHEQLKLDKVDLLKKNFYLNQRNELLKENYDKRTHKNPKDYQNTKNDSDEDLDNSYDSLKEKSKILELKDQIKELTEKNSQLSLENDQMKTFLEKLVKEKKEKKEGKIANLTKLNLELQKKIERLEMEIQEKELNQNFINQYQIQKESEQKTMELIKKNLELSFENENLRSELEKQIERYLDSKNYGRT